MQSHVSERDRFWSKVDVKSPGECWNWKAFRNIRGYGMCGALGKIRSAHRVAWMFSNGPIPDGLCVCHKCDNRACCNPDHLFLGTVQDNVKDAVAKGRHFVPNKIKVV
jgi:hypothetical protein